MNSRLPVSERLSMVVSLTLIGLALYFIIDLPTRTLALTLFGQTIAISASSRLLMTLLLGGLAFSGTGAVIHTHPNQRVGYTTLFWVNPTLLVIFAAFILARLGSPQRWAAGLLVTGALLWLTILGETRLSLAPNPNEKSLVWAQLWSQAMSYALLLGYALIIHVSTLNAPWRIALLTIMAWAIGASMLRTRADNRAHSIFAAIAGLAVGQMVWVFGYTPMSVLQMSLSLLTVFYVILGIARAHLEHTLSARVFAEYGTVLAVSIAVTWWLG